MQLIEKQNFFILQLPEYQKQKARKLFCDRIAD